MAIFNIRIEDSGNIDTGDLNLNVYFGNINNVPSDQSSIKSKKNILIKKEYIHLKFLNDFNNFFIALPTTIELKKILSYNNLYEDLTEQFKSFTNNITIEEDSQNVLYTVYNFNINRKFLNPLELLINIKIK